MTTPDLSIEKRLHTHTIQVLLTDRKCVILRQRREARTTQVHKHFTVTTSRRNILSLTSEERRTRSLAGLNRPMKSSQE